MIVPAPSQSSVAIRRRTCPGLTPCAARFYELKTNRPLYVTKGTRVTTVGQGVTNVDGYDLSYSDQSVITHHAVLSGPEPPKQRIIRSRTFADNVGVLSAYLAKRRQQE